MARYFFDTSALVKFYHAEVGTQKVSAIFSEQGREIRISSIGLIEVQSAFAMKVRAGVIDSRLAGQQRAALMLDVASGGIEVYSANEHPSSADAAAPLCALSWEQHLQN